MLGLLSKVLIVFMIAMLFPTGLVLASQDAVPGDRTYPVKRGLENVIVTLASVHPTTRAFFKADLSKRRYKEAVALVKRDDIQSQTSLAELVTQTEAAVDEIDKISDPKTKQELVQNLTEQIAEYQTGLNKLENPAPSQPASAPIQPVPQPVVQEEPPRSLPINQVSQVSQQSSPEQVSQAQAVPAEPLFIQPVESLPSSIPTPTPMPVLSDIPRPDLPLPAGHNVSNQNLRNTIENLEVINQRLNNLSRGEKGNSSKKDLENTNNDDKKPKGKSGR